jgi:hypothetical protein
VRFVLLLVVVIVRKRGGFGADERRPVGSGARVGYLRARDLVSGPVGSGRGEGQDGFGAQERAGRSERAERVART